MVWQIILLSLGILGFGVLISLLYVLLYEGNMNKAWIGACIVFIVYLIIITFASIPLSAWKALELLGF